MKAGGVQFGLFDDNSALNLSAATHELKVPLGNIHYFASLLLDESSQLDDSIKRDYLWRVKLSAENSLQLVQSLAQGLRADQLELNLQPVNVVNLCEDVLNDVWPLAKALSQTIELKIPKKSQPLALADRMLLKSVMTNLCDNALKHNPPESHVKLQIAKARQNVRLSVSDNGPLVRAADFKRLKSKIGRELYPLGGRVGGSGLGLFIASRLSEAMGGSLNVTRHHAGGMTFAVKLPPSYQLGLF